ncbi:MAG TPA: sodium/glutamate symporter [Spirochaetota bacterium]|nr:sodium/glutamate symporter [Spirochaetota bacterium]
MVIPFPFEALLGFGWLGVMLLLGVFLRAKVGLLQRFLFPSCLIGGLAGLALLQTGLFKVETSLLETFAYHLFNISFISVGLTIRSPEEQKAYGGREVLKGSIWMALVSGVMMPMQAIVGGGMVLMFNFFDFNLFKTFGFFAPLGFVQGPGQVLSVGKVWETLGFANAATIGLTFATIGFLFAFFVGVPMANWGIRRGMAEYAPKSLPKDLLVGIAPKGAPLEPAGRLTMHSGNIDTLAFQFALVGLVYLLTYALVHWVAGLLRPELAATLWGFFFFVGLLVSIAVRTIIIKIGYGHMVDPGVQRRVTGWSVDFLIVATVMAVQPAIVWQYALPIGTISLAVGVLTTLGIVYLGNRLSTLNIERMVGIYGICTGTASSGLLLVRVVDPEFRTTAAMELGFQAIFASVPVLSCMLLVSAPLIWNWSVELTLVVFAGLMLVFLALLKILKFWGKKRF